MPKRNKSTRTNRTTQPKPTPPAPPPGPRVDAGFGLDCAELALLWSRLGDALASDTGSPGTAAERRSTGGSKGSPSIINHEVADTVAVIETGVREIEAQVERALSLPRDRLGRTVSGTMAAFPEWHRRLVAKPGAGPIAAELQREVRRWIPMARRAIGLRPADVPLGHLCPHHRGDHPTQLVVLGRTGTINQSLLHRPAGPPPATAGPLCVRPGCRHESCAWIRRRTSSPIVSDWVWRDGDWLWRSATGRPAYEFADSRTIRCSHCHISWAGRARRVLAGMLRELGDQLDRDIAEHLL